MRLGKTIFIAVAVGVLVATTSFGQEVVSTFLPIVVAANKTVTFNNTLTFAGTDSTTFTFAGTSGNVPNAVSGTWTPTLGGSTTLGSQTYSNQAGTYDVIIDQTGRRSVTARFNVSISALGGTQAGNIIVGGLPFANGSDLGFCYASTWSNVTLSASYTFVGFQINASASNAILVESGSGQTQSVLAVSGLSATTQFEGVCLYHT